ncbi:MAG TPA: ACT domain-containing protein [Methanosarcina sp.]|nr:ACT domain-containing protein [Methanosarcina sp.]
MATGIEDKVIKQISLFAENKPGRLANIANKLKEAEINIRAFTIAESGDFGIIRMVVDRSDYAHRVLHDAGFTVSETNVLGIEMEDVPGSMSRIAEVFGKTKINLDYAYAFVTRDQKALLIVRVSEIEKAVEVLEEENIKLIGMKDLEKI